MRNRFKRGTIHKAKDGISFADRSIICSQNNRNGGDKKGKEKPKGSMDGLPQKAKPTRDCPVKYKFIYKFGVMVLDKFYEIHNHYPNIILNTVTSQMSEDIKNFNKRTKVIAIKEYLEQKYKIKLDYGTIYRELRKYFPRFGNEDAKQMLNIFTQKNISSQLDYDEIDRKIKRLFFALMIEHYKLFGDIVLIDSTYRVNRYNIPLILYSGVNYEGKNILFGIAVVNDETADTHEWCLSKFLELHHKMPNLILTDQDLALTSVLDKKITHFLCQWHIEQNLKKHFSFLIPMNLSDLYRHILLLPYVSITLDFEQSYDHIRKSLKEKNYQRSLEYLEKVYELKNKWATCYTPSMFTANMHTTSRIESINAVIKQYVNSSSEVSDILTFQVAFEEKLMKVNIDPKKKKEEMNPILKDLQSRVSEYIFDLHYEQYILSARYLIDLSDL